MSQFNNASLSREECLKEYESHVSSRNQGYYKTLESYANTFAPLLGGKSPYSKEGWDQIISNDGYFAKAVSIGKRMFKSNEALGREYERMLTNSREVTRMADYGSNAIGLEGWGGGNAAYASSQGAFPAGATPFVIGGWLASARSEEIFQRIDNQNSMRLEFEYNIDYLLSGDTKFYFPKAFRSGEVTGFNKLPKIDWVTPNTGSDGKYTAPETWCGGDGFIRFAKVTDSTASSARGNLLEVSKMNKRGFGLEPNCKITAIKYLAGGEEHEKRVRIQYDIATGATNERIFKTTLALKDIEGFSDPVLVDIVMKVNLDTADFSILVSGAVAAENIITGVKFDGKLSNIANELTNIATMGTDKFQFVRECEYRNYAKVSLNEYMADNFRIGVNSNVSYAAFATDKMLEYTIFNRELEAEDYLIEEVLDDGVDLDNFELTKKMGGFINSKLEFTIGKFAPGLKLQDYKDALKTYVNDTLAVAETELNLPPEVKHEWIFLGYDTIASKFPDISFENAIVDLDGRPSGNAKNENYGFSVGSRCGYVDNLGRSVRIIGNNDSRWRSRGNRLFGAIRTYTMEYPFLVYYPHAIRMFTAIDPDNPNRTSIHLGGREYRGHFAAGAVELKLNGVLDANQMPINNFEAQIIDSKTGYAVSNTPTTVVTP